MSDVIKAGTKYILPYVFSEKNLIREAPPPDEPQTELQESPEEALLAQAVRQAGEILKTAKEQGAQICEEYRKKGYEDGLILGREDGYQEARQKYEDQFNQERREIKAELEACVSSMEKKKAELLDHYLLDLRDIAVAIAEKVIRISLKTSSETMKLMIISATTGLRKKEWVKIHISKYSVDMMMEGDAEFLNALSYLSDNVKIIKMGEEEGTCIVELPDEIIDLSVNTQMANIRELLENS